MAEDSPGPSGPETADRQRIGPYRLIEVLGEGGMGVVWLADQQVPVKRRVALKIIKLGMDTKEVVARFESERQALAVMDHPSIARVYDGGATETGRPYFVMELVHGIPVDEYCDQHKLDTRARIRLFLDICDAVQHAHQKGVVHRDLKPSNILVTVQDAHPVPKVIDFGIAKAMGQDLSDRTMVTTMGQLVGTPEYMSPEQADASGLDIDTRTDVYSLGVTLYELLVGARPFDFHAKADYALAIKIREAAVVRPSTRVSGLDSTRDVLARYRSTTAQGLKKELEGDLDWIVLMAMEKDRTRRYQTVNALSMDLKRYLDDVPVVARPPSVLYRARKFIRRNRVPVAAATVAFVGAVGGAVAASVGFVRARAAEEVAREEAVTAQQVSDFLVAVFEVSDPNQAQGDTITPRELLEQGAQQVRRELRDQPLVQARMLANIGRVYQTLGVYDRSADLLEDALAIREREVSVGDLEVAETLSLLGHTYRRWGRLDQALSAYERALTVAEGHGLAGRELGVIRSSIGVTLLRQGQYDKAEPALRAALALRETEGDSVLVAQTLNDLGVLFLQRGEPDSALAYLGPSRTIRERLLGSSHPDLGATYLNIGVANWIREDYPTAQHAYEQARDIYERALGPGHPRSAGAYNNLGETHWIQGDYERAETLFKRALEIKRAALTPDDPGLTTTLVGLAKVYRDQNRPAEAEPLFREALRIRTGVYGPDHRQLLEVLDGLADVLERQDRRAESATLRARAEAIRNAQNGGTG